MENTQYKGFAYTKNENIKPTVLYGETPDDILKKLNAYNAARTQEYKFQTCNIGSLNTEISKYEDYHRYEVSTGKDITAIYLNIPPLKRDEFQKVTADLKAAGAKFNPGKKAWYVTDGQAGQELQTYLDSLGTNAKANLDSIRRSGEEETEKPDFQIESLEIQYAVKMQNQQTVIIPESTLNKMWSIEGLGGSFDEFFDELNEKAVGQLQKQDIPDPERIADESEYIISVGKQHENQCTVWFNDGREPIEINGYEHGVIFPEMDAGAAAGFVAEYLKNMEQPDRNSPEYHEGDRIDCYVPLRLQAGSPDQPIYVENVSHIVGNIRSVGILANTDARTYEILQEGGSVRTIRSDEIYSSDQARVLLRAAADELTGVQFDLLSDKRLTAAQMEEIRFGFKDGLSAEQVALYANPEMAPAEMDLCRIGLNSGLGYTEIRQLLKETKELSWTDSRNRLNEAIKDHRVIEEARRVAHEAGLPFSENMTSEEMTPYVYDGSMSAEDYKQMLSREETALSDDVASPKGEELSEIQSRIVEHINSFDNMKDFATLKPVGNDRIRVINWTGEALMDLAMNQNGDIVDANTNEIYGAAPAAFYGKQVPVENGKRVISQEIMDELLYHAVKTGMESLDFRNCIFRGVSFQGHSYYTDLFHDADFSGSEFYQCKFHADMRRSSFRDTVFVDTSFKTAILTQCDFSRSEMTRCRFQETDIIAANFSDTYMKNINFVGCAMEINDFNKTRMDTVNVSESCGVVDSKHFDTISTENMSDRVLWRLSGTSDVSYERKEELQKLFQSEKEGSLDSENENWRLDLSRDEEELVDKWDNKIHEEKRLCEDIAKLGYKPTEKLISNIQKLDAITGERHGLKDVRDLYRQNNFQNDQELKQTVLDIAEECKQQELARMAAPVNMPG